jgi:ubiquinone/menaquinone biosynthesis C-methylase UbiE
VARAIVGENGEVTGLDFTDEMLEKAISNNKTLGYGNVKFVKGDIEEMPFGDNRFDVVISNCVLNLVPDKKKAFAGIFRVLKKGGHFCISDVVIKGNLPEGLKKDAEMYAGCVSGAISMTLYLEIIENTGFINITTNKQKEIKLPPETLAKYMTESEAAAENDNFGIYSITVTGYKQ